MTKDITVNITNLSEEERQTLIKLVEKANTPKEGGVFVPEEDEQYHYIGNQGVIYTDKCINHKVDKARLAMGNCFETAEEAEAIVEKLKIHRELQLFADKHNEYEINWGDTRLKFEIVLFSTFDNDKYICVDAVTHIQRTNTVYFTSKYIAEKAIEYIGENKLLDYYFA